MTMSNEQRLTEFSSRQPTPAVSGVERTEETSCEVTAIQPLVAEASGAAVSPAISQAAAEGRELQESRPNASKPCNQSGSQPITLKPNCYECKHRRSLVWDAHSECIHPRIELADRFLSPLALMNGGRSGSMKRLNISGDEHGVKSGWFNWPLNFDPTWLKTCEGFEQKEAL